MLKHRLYAIIELYHETDIVLTRMENLWTQGQKIVCVKLSSMSTDDVPHHVQTSTSCITRGVS